MASAFEKRRIGPDRPEWAPIGPAVTVAAAEHGLERSGCRESELDIFLRGDRRGEFIGPAIKCSVVIIPEDVKHGP
jgi:hypothetical protein